MSRKIFVPRLIPLMALVLLAALAAFTRPTAAAPADVELRVLGYARWSAGGPASLRIIAYDATNARGVEGIPVEAALVVPGRKMPLRLVSGSTNEQGSLDAQFTVPSYLQGSATLRVARVGDGSAPLETPVQIQREERIYLTTDKPLYQPGQSIHVRALALHEPTLVPVADTPLLIEIEDARANKVFKKKAHTSKFGVASAEFDLASEVTMGEYHVRCVLGEQNPQTAEKSFTVKRYILPKFKIALKTDKAWYLPNETVKGTLQADYFFGKPVAGAKVALDVRSFDVGVNDMAHLEGQTSADGTYAFEFKLPEYFVGRPLDKGKASLAIAARVQDAAAHPEESGTQVAVVSSPIAADVFPESGHLVPGLPNQIYVMTTHPDGSPAPGSLSLTVAGQTLKADTDDSGFAQLTFTPTRAHEEATRRPGYGRVALNAYGDFAWDVTTAPLSGRLIAKDRAGAEARLDVSLPVAQQKDAILIRPDKALYRVGDVFHAQILSSKRSGSVYVDFIRENQTILTRSVELHDGRGELSLALTPQTYGAIQVHAYQIAPSADTIRDTRKIFVQPARDLLVEVRPDKNTYRPGEESKLTFIVKDASGKPTLAVLGVDIVDESLFALAERQPGLERVYFLLEKELMQARYEVHGLTMPDVVKGSAPDGRKTEALFTQLPGPQKYTLRLDSFDSKMAQLGEHMQRVQNAAYVWHSRHGAYPGPGGVDALVDEGLLSATDAHDPWGRTLRIKTLNGYPIVYSMGPDGLIKTADDIDMQSLYGYYYRRRAMGGAGRGMREDVLAMDGAVMAPRAAAMPQEAADDRGAVNKATTATDAVNRDEKKKDGEQQKSNVRVREFFPETLFTAPEIVTDEHGVATVRVPMADSITTWRLSAFASSALGKMGNASGSLRVFQDFFVDLDTPSSLTQGDVISMPVAIYNYLPNAQTVRLTLEASDWYEQLDEPTRDVKIAKGEVAGISFKIRAKKPGAFPLTLRATGSKMSDAVRRSVTVMPDGREFVRVKSDRLQAQMKTQIDVPEDAVADATRMLVTIYPGVFSQVVEGLDSILRMPGGCFEQTSSSTYPNVMVTSYLKKMRKTTPEIAMKAEGFINAGYQRLLTFEVPGGGFSVFGQAPANPILTAYGLMEFADMAKVHDVDPNLIARTTRWLLAQQGKEGQWGAGRQGFYAEGWSNVPNSDLVATSYITWALLETGERGPGVERAVQYVSKHIGQVKEPYTAALVANALVAWKANDAVARQALDLLVSMRTDDKDITYWRTQIATAAYGTGKAGDIETTALAALALLGSPNHSAVANRAIGYLVRSKDAFGTWESTQATVLAMKALVATVDKASEHVDANVSIFVNGQKAGTVRLTSENFDVFHQLDVSKFAQAGANKIELSVEGKGNVLYKIATHYWRHWAAAPPPPSDVLSIGVDYDRTTLARDDVATCHVAVKNLTRRVANMVMIDVGVPPGFDVKTEDLEALVGKQLISKFSVTGRQVIIYLTKIDSAKTFELSYRVKARYPVRAQAPASTAYEYYNPERTATVAPQVVEIK